MNQQQRINEFNRLNERELRWMNRVLPKQVAEAKRKERRLFYDYDTNKIFIGRRLKDDTWSLWNNEDGVMLRKKFPKFNAWKDRQRGPLQYIGCL